MFIRQKLAQFMKENGLTQDKLSAKLYITQQSLSNILLGIKQPSVALLKRIANEMQCTMDELVAEN